MNAKDLRDIAAELRILVDRQLDSARTMNALFLDAWHRGILDETWKASSAGLARAWLVYFIRARGTGDIKIGKTKNIGSRIKTLRTGASRGLELVACYAADISHEKELHVDFAPHRLNGEWFVGHRDVLAYLEILGTDTRRFSNETIWEGHLA